MWYLVVRNRHGQLELVAKGPFDTIEEARAWGRKMWPHDEEFKNWSVIHSRMACLYPCDHIGE